MSKVEFRARSAYKRGHLLANMAHCAGLNLPPIHAYRPAGPLAVVGGGLSALQYVETLRRWEGSVWALNGAWKWCRDQQIKASFFSVDPNPIVADYMHGCEEAILGERCDPKAFAAARTTYLYPGVLGGCSSAGASIIAGMMGRHRQVTLFGTECCYQQSLTHVYGGDRPEHELIVKCSGMHFLTQPNLALQAKELAAMILSSPQVIRETSGGFLRAMVNSNCEYDIIECTDGFEETLTVADEPDAR